ncbi:hypothetical protein BBJ28_00007635 [Nothophytophthora sp. Chile5]|nr:hypothetical protein BBJ28_00007635 [Nothophytophthora sp. Chile5]
MEGFLLMFAKERSAQVRYCVLEHGMLRCFDKPEGAQLESIGLTRHRIRVQPLVSDGAGLCPNRFAVHAVAVERSDQAGAFVAASKREQVYCFAAATSKTMIKWANAIHNWRRHPFDDPISSALSVQEPTYSNEIKNPDAPTAKRRAVLLETQRAGLVSLANRFDVKLSSCSSTAHTKTPGLFKAASFRVLSVCKDPAGLAVIGASRSSFSFSSWLPGRRSSLRPRVSGL